jgi:SAM-dependent methyltransferase
MATRNSDAIRVKVRERYGSIASAKGAACHCTPSCCSTQAPSAREQSAKLGYSPAELEAAPEAADMGLGCGNPHAIALLKNGETVLDLGCGGGLDCFLAAKQVGDAGRVIGVDMTPEMVTKARENARKGGYANVEFRLGEIEHLPVADSSVDVILSNCVINLSPDKPRVYAEAHRALKPGGRLAISDIVAVRDLPQTVRSDVEKVAACVGGAATAADIERMLRAAGFHDIRIEVNEGSRTFIRDWFPHTGVEDYVVAAAIQATKPSVEPADAGGSSSPRRPQKT